MQIDPFDEEIDAEGTSGPFSPFAEGVEAALNGLAETDNPYDPVDEDARLMWNDGWASVADD